MSRWRRSVRFLLPVLGAALVAFAPSLGGAASSSTVVSMTVSSATSLDTAGCSPGTPGVTSFGVVMPGTSMVTSLDCVVTFGSSNDTARLSARQTDGVGDAMFQELGGGGALDTGFASGAGMFAAAGLVLADASTVDSLGGIARQSDGRFLVTAENGAAIVVQRYLADGTLDGGFASVSVAACPGDQDVSGISVAADGTFVVGGDSGGACPGVGAWAMRFAANGNRDMAYGGDGIADTGIGVDVRDVTVHSDGSVILAGGAFGAHELVRLEPDGSLDLGFDVDGRASLPLGGNGAIRGVAFLPDGSVVASGYVDPGGGNEAYVARVTAAGILDGAFGGGDGWERTNHATEFEGRRLGTGRDGSLYVAAYQGIAKFTSGGLLDTTWAVNGAFDLAATYPQAKLHAAEVQHDGSVVAFGQWSGDQAVVVRLTPGGALDPSFGTGGVQVHDPPGSGNGANRGTWTEDGDLLIVGPGSAGATILRLDGLAISDYDAGAANWTTPATNAFGACLASIATGASALWTSDGTCGAANGADWNAITTAPTAIAHTTTTATQGATARLRFGVRTLASQRPGSYIAPLTFSVVAPDA